MRLSAIQKDTLFLLHAFRLKGRAGGIRQTALFNIVRSNRSEELYPNNYSLSCRTMAKNGLVILERDESLRLYLTLTELGSKVAETIYNERVAYG
ncbi:hypothetical protein JOE25_005161 [Serratia sp. PL17]|nr:hypothetical protein [Serratia sp. PL17]RYM67338.1 hypothetical protein BSQ99_24540 [Serratia liquefaciens]